ncbi:MAG: DUF1232 domain-containing protein [Cytophagales bacterium]
MGTYSGHFTEKSNSRKVRSVGNQLKDEAYVLYLCSKDKRLSWKTRLWAYIVSMYVFSPFDIIPDFIPFIGHLDDWLLVNVAIKKIKKGIPYYILMEKEFMDQLPIIKDSVMNLMFQALALLIWIFMAFLFTIVFMNI